MIKQPEQEFIPSKHSSNTEEKLSSQLLALLIIDALIDANIVKKEDVETAIEIATVEIDVRKALGDY